MGLVDNWLEGIGLGYAVPIFSAQGINSPDTLSKLSVIDFPELGISDQNDRKKLFYLIQRVRLALDRGRESENAKSEAKRASATTASKKAAAAPQADAAVAPSPSPSPALNHRQPNKPSQVSTSVTANHAVPLSSTSTTTTAAANSGTSCTVRFREEQQRPVHTSKSGEAGRGTSGGGASLELAGDGSRQTPLRRTERMPASRRRPKTPHADETTTRSKYQQQKPTPSRSRGRSTAPDGAAPAPDPAEKEEEEVSPEVMRLGRRLANAETARRSATAAATAAAEAVAAARTRAAAVCGHLHSADGSLTRLPRSPLPEDDDRSTWSTGTPEEQIEANAAMDRGDHRPESVSEEGVVMPHRTTGNVAYLMRAVGRTTHTDPELAEHPNMGGGDDGTSELDSPSPSPERAPRRHPTHKSASVKRTQSSTLKHTQSATRGDFEETPNYPPARTYSASLSPRPGHPTAGPVLSPRAGNRSAGFNTDAMVSRRAAQRPAARNEGASATLEKGSDSTSGGGGTPAPSFVEYIDHDTEENTASVTQEFPIAERQRSVGKYEKPWIGEARRRTQPSERATSEHGVVRGKVGGGRVADTAYALDVEVETEQDSEEDAEVVHVGQERQFSRDAASAAREAAAAEQEEKQHRQEDIAGELAVRLISAHREDVRSALAAARKDMDLVSKADQDRHPTALIEYAKEVEGVLGERLAAAAKLRAALDSYVSMRQAALAVATGDGGPASAGDRARGRGTTAARAGRRVVRA